MISTSLSAANINKYTDKYARLHPSILDCNISVQEITESLAL